MKKTTLNKSLKEFSFEIHYLNDPIDIEHVGDANYEDIIYVRCFPKRNMSEQELKKSIEDNRVLLFKKIEGIANKYDLFYCYFDIDYSIIKGTTTKIIENKICWIEVRPDIRRKDVDNHPKGFIEAGELPPED